MDARITIFFAGDNSHAKATVREMITKLGFDAGGCRPAGKLTVISTFVFAQHSLGPRPGLWNRDGIFSA